MHRPEIEIQRPARPVVKSGLAARLRDATTEAHRQAEGSRFVQSLLQGRVGPRTYRSYLVAMWHVYRALEDGLRQNLGHPSVSPFVAPALERAPAIAADLQALYETRAGDHLPVPEASGYASHLRRLGEEAPTLLVAHAYVRYLGDLSGGQILRRAVARAYGLHGRGLAFYEFPRIRDIDACKREFRERLDRMRVGPTTAAALVEEANLGFAANAAILEALSPGEVEDASDAA